MPLCRPVMPASGPSAIRSATSIAAAARASITAATQARSARPALSDRDANARSRVRPWPFPCRALFGGTSTASSPVGRTHLTEAQFAELVKFCYLWREQSIPYKGDADGKPVSAGIDHPPVARAGGRPQASIGHRGGQAAASHPAGGDAADPQSAGAGGPAADPAHRRRHAADRCRPRGAGAHRTDRGRDRRPARPRST